MIQPKVRVDTSRFNRAFKQYLATSKRDLAEICNQKAFNIAAKAAKYSRQASNSNIKGELQAYSTKLKAPVAALIINKRRGIAGKKGLHGGKMRTAVNRLIRARQRSRGFLRSGWFPAIRDLGRVLKKAFKGAIRGKDKGDSRRAHSITWSPKASIWNAILGSKRTSSPTAQREITKAAQTALNEEERSMRQYVERKLQKTADKFNRA